MNVNPPVGINGVVFKWPGDTVSMDSTYGCIWTDTLWGRNLLATKSWANSQGFLKTANLSGYLTATTSATTLITGTSTMTVGKLGNGYAIGGVSMQLGSDATGDIYYNSSGVLTRLAAGTNGQMLSLAGGVPVWVWPSFSQFNDQSGTSYTLVLGDANQWVTSNNSSAVTFTVPPNSSVAFATGTVIQFINKGAGKLTFSPGSGVTINQPSSYLSLVQGQGGFLVKTATNTWYVFGGVSN